MSNLIVPAATRLKYYLQMALILVVTHFGLAEAQDLAATLEPENYPPAVAYSDAFEPAPAVIVQQKGPFGRLNRSYSPPDGAIYVAVDGDPASGGGSLATPTTIESAIANAQTGDTIVMRGGTYRTGDLHFDTQITIQPYRDERPVLRGSAVATNWIREGAYWFTPWQTLFDYGVPTWHRPDRHGPAFKWDGDLVVVDDTMFRPVGKLEHLQPETYFVDHAQGRIYLHDDPTGRTVEITRYERGLVRDHDTDADPIGPTIRGLTIKHYARNAIQIRGDAPYRLVNPRHAPDAPTHTVIEDCTFAYFPVGGFYVVSPNARIAHNEMAFFGSEVLFIPMSHDAVLEHNIVARSNYFHRGGFPAGFKIFNQGYNVVVRKNYFTEMDCNAVWYDVGLYDNAIVDNFFLRCRDAFKIEIAQRSYIANNIMMSCRSWIVNAADTLIYNNTFIDSHLLIMRNNRGNRGSFNREFSFDHASTGPGARGYHGHIIANNVFTGVPAQGSYLAISDQNDFDPHFPIADLSNNLFTSEAPSTIDYRSSRDDPANTRFTTLEDFRSAFGQYLRNNQQAVAPKDEIFRDAHAADFTLRRHDDIPTARRLPPAVSGYLRLPAGTAAIGLLDGETNGPTTTRSP